jgi:RNA polymerase sigma-70 factor, ECF subfamily
VRNVRRPPLDLEAEFRRLFSKHYRHVLAYALRRTEQRADAEDVVAGTFAVSWRRFRDAPAQELQLAWLYAIAARVLANQRGPTRTDGRAATA